MRHSGLLRFATAFLLCVVSCVMAQSTHPLSADAAIVPQPVSYSPGDATSAPSGAMARTKKLRMACYPVWGQCTKDSDCCTGFCRVGRVTAYCDYK
jgi:hypothetical protein